MAPGTLVDLLSSNADTDAVALGAPAAGEQVYTYDRLATTSRSTATVLAAAGLDADSFIAIAPAPAAETVIGFLGAAILGARVRFSGPARAPVDAVFGPTDTVRRYQVPDDALRIGFGERSEDDRIRHFARAVWRAEDALPDAPVLPTTTVLSDGNAAYTHRRLIRTGQAVIAARGITPDTELAVRAPLTDPRTIAAGLIAPLLAGATIRFPTDETPAGDLAVTDTHAPEHRLLLLMDVPLQER